MVLKSWSAACRSSESDVAAVTLVDSFAVEWGAAVTGGCKVTAAIVKKSSLKSKRGR